MCLSATFENSQCGGRLFVDVIGYPTVRVWSSGEIFAPLGVKGSQRPAIAEAWLIAFLIRLSSPIFDRCHIL